MVKLRDGVERLRLAHHGEEGSVGGVEALEEHNTGGHHHDEDNPGAEVLRGLLLTLQLAV